MRRCRDAFARGGRPGAGGQLHTDGDRQPGAHGRAVARAEPGAHRDADPWPSPVPTPAATPIVLSPAAGLNAQFGYAPPFTRNVPAFDATGTPYIRSRSADPDYTGFVHTWRDGAWRRLDLVAALRAAYPDYSGTEGGGGGPAARVVFDAQDRAYTVVTVRLRGDGVRNVLLWSVDHCATWRAVDLPDGEVVPESWTGHNRLDGPPPHPRRAGDAARQPRHRQAGARALGHAPAAHGGRHRRPRAHPGQRALAQSR